MTDEEMLFSFICHMIVRIMEKSERPYKILDKLTMQAHEIFVSKKGKIND